MFFLRRQQGKLKLGNDGNKKELSTATWLSVLLHCGVATGLSCLAAAEPTVHFEGQGSPMFLSGYDTLDATRVLMASVFHLGVMGATRGIMSCRREYPKAIRFALAPFIGDKAGSPSTLRTTSPIRAIGRALRIFIMATLIVSTLCSPVLFCVSGTQGYNAFERADYVSIVHDLAVDKYIQCPTASQPDCFVPLPDVTACLCSQVDPFKDGNGKQCVSTISCGVVLCRGGAGLTVANTSDYNCIVRANNMSEIDLTVDNYSLFPTADQPDCFVPLRDGAVCLYSQVPGRRSRRMKL